MTIKRLAPAANPGGALCSCLSAHHALFAARLRRIALCLASAAAAHAGDAESVRMTWNRNPEPDIARYELACGTAAGVYSRTVDAGTEIEATVNGLDEGTLYHFAVAAINEAGLKSPFSDEVIYFSGYGDELSTSGWTARTNGGENAFDGDASTLFLAGPAINGVHDLEINLGGISAIEGIRYTPRQDGSTVGNIARYEIYLSEDGVNWGSPVAAGAFSSSTENKEVRFTAQNAAFIRLRSLEEANSLDECAIAEIDMIEASGPISRNQVPVAAAARFSGSENQALEILLSATDADNDPLQYTIATPPAHGTLSGTPPTLLYTPASGFHGADSFTFSASDGRATSASAEISLTIARPNGAPTALPLTLSTTANTALPVVLAGIDPDGDPLAYTILTQPAHGTLSGTPPNLTYKPTGNYVGQDSFSFSTSDKLSESPPATVSLVIKSPNSSPIVASSSVTTPKNQSLALRLTALDAEGDPLTFQILSTTSFGTLTGTPPNIVYTPNKGFHGNDSLTYKANDGLADSLIGAILIKVLDTNAPPVAAQQTVATNKRTAASIRLEATDADDDKLTFAIVSAPAHGILTGTAPNLTYTPTGNFSGTDSFTFKANDGTADSATATVSIQVKNTNVAPTVADASFTTAEDTQLPIVLTASDPDEDKLTYEIVTPPSRGILTGTAPNLNYIPAANYHGPDSFTFHASDGSETSEMATVSITITPVNDLPLAIAKSVVTTKRTAISIKLEATDADDDKLTFAIVSSPTHGILTGTAPNLTYTPTGNFSGTDSFTFKANDGTDDSAPAIVSIQVKNTNSAPTVAGAALTTAEDTALPIALTASDPDDDKLTYAIHTQPSHGTLTGTAPNLTYIPAANYYGPDFFTYCASDGSETSEPATVSITITSVNDLPLAIAKTLVATKRTAFSIKLEATDADDDKLTFAIVSAPAHGILTGTAPNLTYTPTGNFSGTDSFTFKANDGTANSSTATVSIQVKNTNAAPTVAGASFTTAEDTALPIVLTASDPNDDKLTFEIVTPLAHGTLTGTAPNLTYIPIANYHGSDSFAFRASDGSETSEPATVSITVTPENDLPLAIAKSVVTTKRTAVSIKLEATDADDDKLTFTIVSAPAHGILTGTAPNLTYTPTGNFSGTESFTFKANDSTADSAPATVSIQVKNTNTAPLVTGASFTTAEDTALPIVLTASDPDDDKLTYEIVTPPAHGILTGTAPNLTYMPTANYHGSDSFTYRASDGSETSEPATVSITITSVNDLPLAIAKSVVTTKRTAIPIKLEATDADDDKLTFAIVSAPAHGILTGTAPNLTYTPTGNFSGTDSFTFKANDGTDDSATATVSIQLKNTNAAPIVANASFTTAEDTQLSIVLIASDPDEDKLTYEIHTQPSHGTLTGTAPNLTYTPAANYHGPDSLAYRASDGVEKSATATVSITITPVNDLPVVASRTLLTSKRKPAPITLFASDPDGDTLVFNIVSKPAHGVLSGTPPVLIYTPDGSFTGIDQFKYRANDGQGDSATATVFVTVTGSNDRPESIAQSVATTRNVPVAITLAATDADGDPLSYSLATAAAHGTLTGTAPALIYQPADGFTGTDSFTFVANDGMENSRPATVSIAISKEIPFAGATVLSRAGWSLVSADSAETAHPATAAFDGDPSTFWRSAAGTPAPHEIRIDLGASADVCGFQYLPGPDSGHVAAYEFLVSADGLTWGTPAATGSFADASGEKQVLFTTVTGRFVLFRAVSAIDGSDAACVAELNIIAGPHANRRPIAIPKIFSTAAAEPLSIGISSADPDGDAVSHRIATQPAHGVLSGQMPNLFYTSAADFTGLDSFTFIANDGAEDSKPATITISVSAGPGPGGETPPPPVFDPSTTVIRGVRNASIDAKITATDAQGEDSLNFQKVSGPEWIVVEPDGTVRATPMEAASFEVIVTDRRMASATATVRIVLVEKPDNHAPGFARATLDFRAGTELLAYRAPSLASFTSDPDRGDKLVFTKVSGPAWLRIASSGALSGTPAEGSAGMNSFVVRAADPSGASATATLRMEIRPNALPLPWTLNQLGRDTLACFAKFRAGIVTLAGSGKFRKTSDDAAFAWQKINGNGDITVRLKKSAASGNSARVGIAIRESLAADARLVFLGIDGNGKIKWVRRTENHGKSNTATRGKSGPGWLRLSRAGRVVTASRSDDGKTWETIGKTKIVLPKSSYIGLSVSSGKDTATSTAKFQSIRITP